MFLREPPRRGRRLLSVAVKSLLFSTLYPSRARPGHGLFVETRLRELLKTGRVEARVVAPVPWFPSSAPCFGDYARWAATPRSEVRDGIQVEHPRYPYAPNVGQDIHPFLLAVGALPALKRLIGDGFDFDLIDAHFLYPDGAAARLLARWLAKPFICTARGSDINLYRQFPIPRRWLRRTLLDSRANIGVCNDLVQQMVELGAPPERCQVIRNGVDLQRFVPLDRKAARRELGLAEDGLLLVSVGHLVELKGNHLVIGMLVEQSDARLAIIGSGPERERLVELALRLGVKDRVHFAGQRTPDELKFWFSAADALVLASSREGWPNVLLESMACGTPVVATAVNGTPEVVAEPAAGQLAAERSIDGLLAALRQLLTDPPSRSLVRAYAERFSWDDSSRAQVDLFESVRAGLH